MATRFVNVDRDAPMLLPPDLREWVPADTGYANADTIEHMEQEGKNLYVAASRNAVMTSGPSRWPLVRRRRSRTPERSR